MAELRTISREEIAANNHRKSCWLIIHGNVYDVTKYLDEHPGGEEVMLEVSGDSSEASDAFDDIGHSEDAKSMMKKYLIGKAAPGEGTKKAKKEGSGGAPLPVIAIGVALLAVAGWFLSQRA
ncbi:hypothetical protein DFJ74DRAFT_692377 [Hyaloraphidium curvatum]|nr:hypothetical protein DFJ74DRAFT_692377 [Hyaloraphidium curvatum]